MKQPKIAVINTTKDRCQKIESRLETRLGILDDLNIVCDLWEERKNSNFIGTELFENRDSSSPNLIIIDSEVAGFSGINIVNRIKTLDPSVPIILTYNGAKYTDLDRRHIEKNLDKIVQNNSLIGGYFSISKSDLELQNLVRKLIWAPISVGVIGQGFFGEGIVEHLRKLKEVREIKIVSENYPFVNDKRDYGPRPELMANDPKLKYHSSLEEVLEGSDCVLICTSKIKKGDPKIAKLSHRLDLIYLEGEDIINLYKRIKSADYKGLIVDFRNPIGCSLALGLEQGLEQGQLTSPLHTDDFRIKDFFKRNYSEKSHYIDPIFLNDYRVVGDHGNPLISGIYGGDNPLKSANGYEGMLRIIKEHKGSAVKFAESIARDTMRASFEMSRPYSDSCYHASKFVIDLAKFVRNPLVSYYTPTQFYNLSGFLGIPVEVSYFPNIRVRQDSTIHAKIDLQSQERLEQQLGMQIAYLKNFKEKLEEKY